MNYKAPTKCGICGGKSLNDLGKGRSEGTVICLNQSCQAKFWKRWYTAAEWFKWINEKAD